MYKDKKVIHIVCTGKNGEIGYDNKLLFNLPPDMKFFREQTLGNVVMIGRNTVGSLPKPLDRRITEAANDVDNCDTWYKIPKDDFTMFEHTNWMDHTNPLGETLTYRFTKWIHKQVSSS